MARPKSNHAKEKRLGFRVSDEDYLRLSEYARLHEQTMTQAVTEAIRLMLDRDEKGN